MPQGENTSAVCDAAVAGVIKTIVDQDLFEVVHAQHSELFQVLSAKYPVKIERHEDLGGVMAEESPFETIIHEAYEDASLPADLLHCDDIGKNGLVIPDTVYAYDIQLDEDAVPKPRDGEVKELYLMTMK
ncbi:NUDIX domain-containing protein [Seiridium cupressi]